jgi:hypothetical protein
MGKIESTNRTCQPNKRKNQIRRRLKHDVVIVRGELELNLIIQA